MYNSVIMYVDTERIITWKGMRMKFQKLRVIKVLVALLVLGWVGFIFYMSSQTAVNSGNMSRGVTLFLIRFAERFGILTAAASDHPQLVQKYDSAVRSLAHMGMYFLLCLIIALVLKYWGFKRWAYISFIACFAISILDELNQMHFKGRNDSGRVSSGMEDLVKDIIGAVTALLIALLIINIVNWFKLRKASNLNTSVKKISKGNK